MCFAFDASPPDLPADIAPIAGGAGAELLELESADGTRFSAALAESPEPRGRAVVILPDVRGLYPFYSRARRALRRRRATTRSRSTTSAAPPGSARAGRTSSTCRTSTKTAAAPEFVQADARRRSPRCTSAPAPRDVAAVGFCFGGTQAFLAATNAELGLAGVIGFYGSLSPERWGENSPIRRAGEMHGPVLGLFGGADEGIPPDQVEAFERGLAEAGVEHEIVTYPGAPHSFFDRRYEEHAEACADAWRRILAFL